MKFILSILLLYSNLLLAQWRAVTADIAPIPIVDIQYISPSKTLAFTNMGEVFMSLDSLKSFKNYFSGENTNIIEMKKNNGLWWFSFENKLAISKDEGNTWKKYTITPGPVSDFFCVDSITWFCSVLQKFYVSRDEGLNWELLYTGDYLTHLYNLCYYSNKEIIALYNYGDLIKTYDGGRHWKIYPQSEKIISMIKVDSTSLISVVSLDKSWSIKRSTDKGETWIKVKDNIPDYRQFRYNLDIDIKDSNIFISYYEFFAFDYINENINAPLYDYDSLTGNFHIFHSSNKGLTWKELKKSGYDIPTAFEIIDDSTYLTGNTNGELFKLENYGANYTKLFSSNPLGFSTGVSFINRDTGYITTTPLMKTEDGGKTFKKIVQEDSIPIGKVKVYALSNDELITCTSSNKIARSSNGGRTWVETYFGEEYLRYSFLIMDNVIYMNGSNYLYRSNDYGISWKTVSRSFWGVSFLDSLIGFGIINDTLYKTTDGGQTFSQPEEFTYSGIILIMIDEKHGIMEGYYPDYHWCTINGGKSWFSSNLDFECIDNETIQDIYLNFLKAFKFEGEAYAFTAFKNSLHRNKNALYISLDSGKTWITELSTSPDRFVDVDSKDGIAWAITKDGTLYRRELKKQITSVKNENQSIVNYYLTQNYPNPFNPTTTIKFNIPERDIIKIKVYDALGREIRTLLNEERNPGNYELVFNANGLPSGVYFYSIQTRKHIEAKKMILLK